MLLCKYNGPIKVKIIARSFNISSTVGIKFAATGITILEIAIKKLCKIGNSVNKHPGEKLVASDRANFLHP